MLPVQLVKHLIPGQRTGPSVRTQPLVGYIGTGHQTQPSTKR